MWKQEFSIMKNNYCYILLVVFLSVFPSFKIYAQLTVNFEKRAGIPLFKKFQQYSAGSIPYKKFERDFDKLSEINSSSLRIDLSIGKDGISAFPDLVSGTSENLKYNFSVLDKLAINLIERDVQPVYSWCYIPVPFQTGSFRKLNPIINAWEYKWYTMHKEFAKHYRQRDLPVFHEIYNEPDYGEFLDTDTWQNYYDKMFVSAAKGLKAGDPDAVIGAPASACGPCGYTRDILLLAKRNNISLDFFSFHSYNSNFSSFNSIAQWLFNEGFKTTDIYIDEFNWYVPWEAGAGDAADCNLNIYSAAGKTFDTFNQMLQKTRISMVHWAMFMNAGINGIGMVNWEGRKRAVFNAFKIFADMPVDRKELISGNVYLKGFASSDEHKLSTVIWNSSTTPQTFNLEFINPPLTSGILEVYRIDSKNASLNNGATENLEIVESKIIDVLSGYVWSGEIPGESVIYITAHDSLTKTFDFSYREKKIGNITQVLHYYPSADCNTPNYAEFNAKTWTAFLGISSENNPYCQTAVKVYNLPESINFSFITEGGIINNSNNSLLGLRIDFQTGQGFVKSALFHGSVYNENRTTEVPWGTGLPADTVLNVNLKTFNIKFSEFAPDDWNGKTLISFILDDCGLNTRAIVTAEAVNPVKEQIITFDSIPTTQFDGPDFELHAESSSGLPVKFEIVEGEDIITLDGDLVKLSGKQGYVEIKAFQEGNGVYAYTSAFRRFLVSNPEIPVGTGTGLYASYWTGEGVPGTISGNEKFFVDSICGDILWPTIDYIWYSEGPGCNIGPDFWSIRWNGFIQPLYSEEYTFLASIDDGVKVTIDGDIVIDDYPGGHSLMTKTGKIFLQAGKKYPIIIDFTQWWNNSAIKFEWESKSQLREIVPSTQLYIPDIINNVNEFTVKPMEVKVYPNPAYSGNFTIEFQNFSENNKPHFEIYNIQGKLLLKGILESQQTEIDISGIRGNNFCILKIISLEEVGNYILIIN